MKQFVIKRPSPPPSSPCLAMPAWPKSSSWSDAEGRPPSMSKSRSPSSSSVNRGMTPIDQPEDAPIRAEFYKKVTDKEASQAKALWSKLVSPARPDAEGSRQQRRSEEAVAADPKAIGYIEKSAVDATVKVVLTRAVTTRDSPAAPSRAPCRTCRQRLVSCKAAMPCYQESQNMSIKRRIWALPVIRP